MNTNITNGMNANHTTEYEKMEKLVGGGFKIIIDTCSLLAPAFCDFMDNIRPMLDKYDNMIIVPVEVTRELKKLYDKKPELREAILKALNAINEGKDKYFKIRGCEGDPFPDNLFQMLCARFRREYKLLFITQDRSLAADLLNQNLGTSVKGKPVIVKRIDRDGWLENHYLNRVNGFYIADKLDSNEMFNPCSEATNIPDDIVPVKEVPTGGDIVYAKRPNMDGYAQITLGEAISAGGEGTVYRTNKEFVAKIYLKDKVTVRRRDKVLLMSSKNLNVEGVCFPIMSLFNRYGDFVGYLMEEARGKELKKSAFLPHIKSEHPDWRKEDQVELCVTIIEKVKELHRRNILIGDINPGNILVESPKSVYFVDTDSYQIESYPCPVGQAYYTAPEIQGRRFDGFLRTESSENFALAVLLFQILMAGKHPYAHAGNGEISENIRNMEFPYNLGEAGTKQTPEGAWKFIWSHFPYDVKDAFFNTFTKDGRYSDETKRLQIGEWYRRMNKYLDMLRNGDDGKMDPMSLTLFPNRFKAPRNAEWTQCKCCGERIPHMKGKTAPKYCNPCRQKLEERFFCEDCGEEFVVTVSEKDYLKEKGFPLPKRCPDCRGKRKEKQKTAKSMAPRKTAGKRDYGSLVFDMFDMFDSFAPEPATVKPAAPAAQQATAPKPAAKPVTPPPAPVPVTAQTVAPSPAAPVAQPVMPKPAAPQPAAKPVTPQAAPEPALVPVAAQAATQTVAPKSASSPAVQTVTPKPAAAQPAKKKKIVIVTRRGSTLQTYGQLHSAVPQPVLQSEPVPQPALQPMPQPVRESAPVPQPASKPVADTQTAVPLNTGEEPKREGYFVRAVRLFNNILKF